MNKLEVFVLCMTFSCVFYQIGRAKATQEWLKIFGKDKEKGFKELTD